MVSVKNGQCKGNRYYNDCKGHRERSEMREKRPPRAGHETWYATSFFIPKSTPHLKSSGTTILQFQDGKASGPMNLGLTIYPEGLELTQADPRVIQTNDLKPPKPMMIKTVIGNGRLRNRWHDVIIHARWSLKKDGFLHVYLNGRKVHSHKGRNIERNTSPKFKFGIYRSSLHKYRKKYGKHVPTQTVYFDAIAKGKSKKDVTLY